MSVARSILRRLDNVETLVCEALLALFVLLLFAQVLARQLFGYSIAWSEELSTYMFVWFAYLGAVVAAKMSAHNRVTFHFRFLPLALTRAMRVLADLLWVAFNLYFVWLCIEFIQRMNVFWKSQTLGVPMKFFYLVLPIAFTLMSIRILWNLYLEVFQGVEFVDPEKAEIEKLKRDSAATAA
jgi:TRAP-type C4-dicarboxylate transport system permease small subunit